MCPSGIDLITTYSCPWYGQACEGMSFTMQPPTQFRVHLSQCLLEHFMVAQFSWYLYCGSLIAVACMYIIRFLSADISGQ